MTRPRPIRSHLPRAIVKVLNSEAGAGISLMAAAALAMVLANSPLATAYHGWFHHELPWTPIPKLNTLHLWINDGFMAIFFFVVGLEIKREVVGGQLARPDQRRLPVFAAASGMIVPALIYVSIAGTDGALQRGWAIPAATDIAFAVGVLALVGKRLPPSLRLFLLTVAIVDDLGAVAIIALFYTSTIKLGWLIAALVPLALMIWCNRTKVDRTWPFAILFVLTWYAVLHSGVHATVAGVLAALTVPYKLDSRGNSLLLRLEHDLVPWNSYFIVPVFGFANAGVTFSGEAADAATGALPLAIAAGLFLGKQIGIFGSLAISRATGFAPLPEGASWTMLWGISLLCGIGFTMSLFISGLAFPTNPVLFEEAKMGIIAGSLVSALAGAAVLAWASRGRPTPE